jgi:glycerophosphoryl diester phosphodiesterase
MNQPMNRIPKITSHRTAGHLATPNSLSGIIKALELGADIIECDIRATKDGILVLHHGKSIPEVGCIGYIDFKTLLSVSIGDGEPIPTLKQAINLIKGKAILQIEVKDPSAMADVCKEIVENHIEQDVIVTSFFHKALLDVKKINPLIKTGMLILAKPIDIISLVKACKADCLHIGNDFIDEELMTQCRNERIPVSAFNTHDLREFERLRELQVDAIGTDRLDIAIKWREKL